MIVAPILLKSAICESRDRRMGTIVIVNDGTPTSAKRHNYDVRIQDRNGRTFRRGKIKDWDREGQSPMQLLKAALVAAGY